MPTQANGTRVLTFILLLCLIPASEGTARPGYQGAYLFMDDYPSDVSPGWHEDVQGIAHDDQYWYITQADVDEEDECRIWRIPKGQDLSDDVGSAEVYFQIDDVYDLCLPGYRHLGDLDCYYHEGSQQTYLAVPIHDHRDPRTLPTVVAFFRCGSSGPTYLGKDFLHIEDAMSGSGWCAFDPEGNLHVPGNYGPEGLTAIFRYSINWEDLASGSWPATNVALDLQGHTHMYDESGTNILNISHNQGGTFSSDGSLLFHVSGYGDGPTDDDGINVFETQTWRRVAKSNNNSGWMFGYEFHYDISQEPQGCTYWDLDDAGAPNIPGQLHVLLLENYYVAEPDHVFLKHYTNKIYVDHRDPPPSTGRPGDPWPTVAEAAAVAWDRSRILVSGGTYPGGFSVDNKTWIEWWKEGSVIVGSGVEP
ncbi:hypothetical protein ACFL6M_02010 [Candidatus Eisenbacteria bacterium]|uniref:Uncharacterized protein n=1 Tax=Eiseniibacteriota bacterium TaxID=2212470 RepID=A0ABV6YJ44_UNCEI